MPSSLTSNLAGADQIENRQNWYSLLRAISMIQTPATGFAIFVWIALYFVTHQEYYLRFMLANMLITSGSIGCSLVLKFGKERWLNQATAILFSSMILCTSWGAHLTGISSGVLGLFIWTYILGSLLGFPKVGMRALGILVVFLTAMPILGQSFHIVEPVYDVSREAPLIQLLIWMVVVSLVIVGMTLYKVRLNKAMAERAQYSQRMEQFNRQLLNASATGSDLSMRVNSMSMELRATSQQQANGAAEQSSSVLSITTTLEEMGQSAGQIVVSTRQVFDETQKALEMAREIKQVSEEASETARRGQNSVEASISGFEQVRIRIETVAQRLLALTESSKQIGAVIEIISGIADETHLLALNATIESAGAGENGLRFGVIAGEVKNLADRVIESTQEVKKIIVELQGAVAAAVLAAEESKKETNQAVHKSYESGMVINEVNQAVTETADRGNRIATYVEGFSRLTEEIKLSMQMQQNVNGQLIGSVKSIRTVAQESAAGSRQVAETAQKLSEMINQLKDVLDISEIEEKLVA